jgi:hypothetical protein
LPGVERLCLPEEAKAGYKERRIRIHITTCPRPLAGSTRRDPPTRRRERIASLENVILSMMYHRSPSRHHARVWYVTIAGQILKNPLGDVCAPLHRGYIADRTREIPICSRGWDPDAAGRTASPLWPRQPGRSQFPTAHREMCGICRSRDRPNPSRARNLPRTREPRG